MRLHQPPKVCVRISAWLESDGLHRKAAIRVLNNNLAVTPSAQSPLLLIGGQREAAVVPQQWELDPEARVGRIDRPGTLHRPARFESRESLACVWEFRFATSFGCR